MKRPSKPGTKPAKRVIPRIGRNVKCPCGSGTKFKACHGEKPDRKCSNCVCQAGSRDTMCAVCCGKTGGAA